MFQIHLFTSISATVYYITGVKTSTSKDKEKILRATKQELSFYIE
jgi:hypothetical protein